MEGKEMVRIVDNKKQKHPEERQYLICIRGIGGAEDEWEIVTGRSAAYEYIKNAIEYIDFEESFILVETLTLNKRKSIVSFMQYAEEFFDDGFDISDYIKGDWDEQDFEDNNEIDPKMQIDPGERLSMADILSGNVSSKPLD